MTETTIERTGIGAARVAHAALWLDEGQPLGAPDIVQLVHSLLETSGAEMRLWNDDTLLDMFETADRLRALLVTDEDQAAYVDHEKTDNDRLGAPGWRASH